MSAPTTDLSDSVPVPEDAAPSEFAPDAPPSTHTRRTFMARGGAVAAGTALASVATRAAAAQAAVKRPGGLGSGAARPKAARPKKAKVLKSMSQEVPAGLPKLSASTLAASLTENEVTILAAMLQSGKVSSVELTEAYFEKVKKYNGPFETYADNGHYGAFVRINEEDAYESARVADERLAASRLGGPAAPFLCGIPMGFKDSVAVQGYSTQDGSAACAGNIALDDATIVGLLRAQGVVPMGLTVCSEFSGSTTGTYAGNAWNPIYIPGGSSQGSGCATAACLAAACIGEETGGSIIYPSAINGCSGIKPSLGTVSIAGLMPLNPGYDVLGPIARSGRDAALILNAMIGIDPANDPQTLAAPIPFPLIPYTARTGSAPLTGLKIGIPQTDWMTVSGESTVENGSPQSHYSPQHLKAFEALIKNLEELGAKVVTFPGLNMNETTGANPANPYYSSPAVLAEIYGSKISPSSALIDGNRYEIEYASGPEAFVNSGIPSAASIATLKRNYGMKLPEEAEATFAGATKFYGAIPSGARAEGVLRRRALINNYERALEDYGIDFMLIMQVGTVVEPRVNSEGKGGSYGGASRRYYQVNNVLGWPTVSFPIGFSTEAPPKNTGPAEPLLPISAQFWGPRFSEANITQAMIDYQNHYPEWHSKHPVLTETAVPTTALIPKAKTDEIEREPQFSNDVLIHEEKIRAEAE